MLPAAEVSLFNGKDLSGWARMSRHEGAPADQKPGFVVQDGLLVTVPDAPEDDLWFTRQKIGDATLRVVYKVSDPSANSGVFIRIPVEPKSEDDAINKGIEVQIQDTGDDWHCTGVLYSMTQAKARPYKPAGEWNTLEIALSGPRTVVKLNGPWLPTMMASPRFRPRPASTNPTAVPAPTPRVYRDPAPRRAPDDLVQGDYVDHGPVALLRGKTTCSRQCCRCCAHYAWRTHRMPAYRLLRT